MSKLTNNHKSSDKNDFFFIHENYRHANHDLAARRIYNTNAAIVVTETPMSVADINPKQIEARKLLSQNSKFPFRSPQSADSHVPMLPYLRP